MRRNNAEMLGKLYRVLSVVQLFYMVWCGNKHKEVAGKRGEGAITMLLTEPKLFQPPPRGKKY